MKKLSRLLYLLVAAAMLLALASSPATATGQSAPDQPDVPAPAQVTATQMPPPIRQWLGLRRVDSAGDPDVYPPGATDLNEQTIIGAVPDTSGAAGYTHFLQAVNKMVALYEKDGTLVEMAPFATFWATAAASVPAPPPSACLNAQAHHGQPYVMYDHLALRWVVADVAYENVDSGPYFICVAVSKSNKPILPVPPPAFPLAPGTYFSNTNWFYYAISTNEGNLHYYPDMIKIGLWPDGYYFSADMYDIDMNGMNRNLVGAKVWAANRADMVGGLVNTFRYVPKWLPEELGYEHLVPSNLLGTPPPNGTPNYYASIQPGVLHIWQFKVNWLNLAASTFGKVVPAGEPSNTLATDTGSLDVRQVVPQVDTDEQVDAHGDRLMSPLQYRIVNGVPSLWTNYTVQPSGEGTTTGIRWHEIQFAADGTPNFVQTGVHKPNDIYWRWLGSMAVDQAGNMALGFSVSQEDQNCTQPGCKIWPSIAYAGRLRRDPAGLITLSDNYLWKTTAAAGNTASQFDSPLPGDADGWDGPWGRQSQMSVDPLDNCVFWYTNMYYGEVPTTATANYDWQTRIGFFTLKDCRGGATSRVSLSTSGVQGNLSSGEQFEEWGRTVATSADGRFVAFASEATNLVSNDTNGYRDVFVRDRDYDNDGIFDEADAVQTVCISCRGSGNVASTGNSWEVSVSSSGRYVAFMSEATNLLATPDTNGAADIYLYDRQTGTMRRVSVTDGTTNGEGLGGGAWHPFISGDGRYVTFDSNFTNLVSGDTNNTFDVFVRDLAANRTYRVSLYNAATPPPTGRQLTYESRLPTLSENGKLVSFQSRDPQLAPTSATPVGDANLDPNNLASPAGTGWDVFLAEWATGVITTVSHIPGGGITGDQESYSGYLAAGGRQVVYASRATNLVTAPDVDTNNYADIFVWDPDILGPVPPWPSVTRVSVSFFGTQAINGNSYNPSISSNGRYVAFSSQATNLDAFLPDLNNKRDVFLHDRGLAAFGIYDVGLTQRISLDLNRGEANGASVAATVASQGGQVVFASEATDLVNNDTNNRWDVFAYATQSSQPIFLRIPGNIPGTPGQQVTVPIQFSRNNYNIDAVAFAIDFDENCLSFEPSATNAVTFNTGSDFATSYTYNPGNTGGEIAVAVVDASAPTSNLVDGTLMSVKFRVKATCQAAPGATTTTRVGFSINPAPSFGSFGQSVKGTVQDGFISIGEGMPGDCNGDGGRNAGDLSALVLEIFDNDVVSPGQINGDPALTPNGTFPGNSVGCNPNQDNSVNAGDLSCIVLQIFGSTCGTALNALHAPEAGVTLALPDTLPVKPGMPVFVPVTLNTSGQPVNSTVFSLDFDETWLGFNGEDADGNGIPDGVDLRLPAGFVGAVVYDPADADGELDIAVYNLMNPSATLPNGPLMFLTFTAQDAAGPFVAEVKPASDLPASFGSSSGTDLPGLLEGGSVWISRLVSTIWLPAISK